MTPFLRDTLYIRLYQQILLGFCQQSMSADFVDKSIVRTQMVMVFDIKIWSSLLSICAQIANILLSGILCHNVPQICARIKYNIFHKLLIFLHLYLNILIYRMMRGIILWKESYNSILKSGGDIFLMPPPKRKTI